MIGRFIALWFLVPHYRSMYLTCRSRCIYMHVHLFFFGGEEEDSIHYGYLIGYLDAVITSDKVNWLVSGLLANVIRITVTMQIFNFKRFLRLRDRGYSTNFLLTEEVVIQFLWMFEGTELVIAIPEIPISEFPEIPFFSQVAKFRNFSSKNSGNSWLPFFALLALSCLFCAVGQ